MLAASVNDFDRAAIHGRYTGSTGQRHPMLLGRDFVGRVTAVGADVDYIDVGLCVAGTLAPRAPGQPGAFADLVAVPVGWLAPVPDGIDLAHVAAVGLAGVTALGGDQCAGRHTAGKPRRAGSGKRGRRFRRAAGQGTRCGRRGDHSSNAGRIGPQARRRRRHPGRHRHDTVNSGAAELLWRRRRHRHSRRG